MSSLKMYNFNPQPKGLSLPEGFILTKFSSEDDIAEWVEICSDGLIDPSTGFERFHNEITNADGPDAYRDTYFIEKNGKKIATFTVVPDMWSTGMGYIHMVACKSECRGLGIGKFIADYSLKLLKDIGKERIFLVTSDSRLPALKTYISAGFLPVNFPDDEGREMPQRWQNIIKSLKIDRITMLDENGDFDRIIESEEN